MRKNVKEIQITKEEITYIANDGTEFKIEDECRKYEDTAECAIWSALAKIVQEKSSVESIIDDSIGFAYDGVFYAIQINSTNDIEIVNKWIVNTLGEKYAEEKCISTEAIGKTLIFEEYEGWIVNWGTIDEMVERFKKSLLTHLTNEEEAKRNRKNADALPA